MPVGLQPAKTIAAAALIMGAAALSLASAAAAPRTDGTIPATPLGITLESASGPLVEGDDRNLSWLFADPDGRTLYFYQLDSKNKSSCYGECALQWPPALVPAYAHPIGNWGSIKRKEGTSQWTYRDRPLYRSARDTGPHQVDGKPLFDKRLLELGSDDPGVAAASERHQFEDLTIQDTHWHPAVFTPADDMARHPPEVTLVARVKSFAGPAFADRSGMTLYFLPGENPQPPSPWRPLLAGRLSSSRDDWRIVEDISGVRQWAYRVHRLYTYEDDRHPGDTAGEIAGGEVAFLYELYRPKEVGQVTLARNHWSVLTNSDGRSLYVLDRYQGILGHNLDPSRGAVSDIGRYIGTAACDQECERTWRPFIAPVGAQSSGLWTVVERAGGVRQWAYEGYPLYTNVRDEAPGDIRGHDTIVFQDYERANFWRLAQP